MMRRVNSSEVVVSPLWQTPAAVSVSGADTAPVRRQTEHDMEEARKEGYREGYARGLEQAQAQVRREAEARQEQQEREVARVRERLEDERRRWASLVEGLSSQVERQLAQSGDVAVSVAYAAVAKFLGDGYADRDFMQALIRHALADVEQRVDCVRVSEQDAVVLQEDSPVQVVGDPRLSPGQCVLETRLGQYETGLDVRLDLLKKALLSGLARHHAGESRA